MAQQKQLLPIHRGYPIISIYSDHLFTQNPSNWKYDSVDLVFYVIFIVCKLSIISGIEPEEVNLPCHIECPLKAASGQLH